MSNDFDEYRDDTEFQKRMFLKIDDTFNSCLKKNDLEFCINAYFERYNDSDRYFYNSAFDNVNEVVSSKKPIYRRIFLESDEEYAEFIDNINLKIGMRGGTGKFWAWNEKDAKNYMLEYRGSKIDADDIGNTLLVAIIDDADAIDLEETIGINVMHATIESEIRLKEGCKNKIFLESIQRGNGDPIAYADYACI